MTTETTLSSQTPPRPSRRPLVFDILLLLVLLLGAYFRMVGIYWGEYQYLHPDERFLVWVGTDITPLKCLDETLAVEVCPPDQKTWMGFKEYFDTARSTLNPHNRNHGFYVYGTLPMFLTRYLVEMVFGHSGFQEMTQIGRPLSAMADILLVLLVFLAAERLYDRRVATLAAAFSAFTVLQIQQSHFFTTDTFITFFTFLAIYFAVRIATDTRSWRAENPSMAEESGDVLGLVTTPRTTANPQRLALYVARFFTHPLLLPSIGFGIALGCAVASKLSAAPVAFMLPFAVLLRIFKMPPRERERRLLEAFIFMALAAVLSILVFRLFQPYAFSGPGFFGFKPNPSWVANIREQRAQAAGDMDLPFALQWARRPVWFSFQHMVLWGMGLPLGILSWAGFLWAGWRILKGEWQ
ncbi:MAG: phospholipid carrier-dependent glycosyltransferase, partial [Chloroflexota bacterium]